MKFSTHTAALPIHAKIWTGLSHMYTPGTLLVAEYPRMPELHWQSWNYRWDYLISQYPHDRVSQNARVTPAALGLS